MTQFSLDMQVGISGDTLGEEEKVESHLSREKVKVRSIPLEGEVSIKGRPWGGAGWNGAGHEHLLRREDQQVGGRKMLPPAGLLLLQWLWQW